MKMMATTAIAFLLLSIPSFADGPEPDIMINGGTMTFEYTQVPPGPVNGQFSAKGILVHDPPNEGVAGTTYLLDGTYYATVVGALEDGANYTDGGVIVVSDPDDPIAVGSYDLDGTVGIFAFIDDAVDWAPPPDLFKANWTEELLGIDAAGKYGSTSGTVTFTDLNDSKIAGTFECTVTDQESGITLAITSGTFNADGVIATERSTWSTIKALYR
jgi:hypothetical protein